MKRDNDIKAPDGYLLGGERSVRQDGTILFQRGWWQAPKEWAGEYVWVHCLDAEGNFFEIEVAPPGYSDFSAAKLDRATIVCPRTARAEAKGTRQHV